MIEPFRSTLPPNRRGALKLTLDPVFGSLFWGKLVSAFGVWLHNIVAVIAVYSATRSAFVVGLVSVFQFAPQLLFAPLSGKISDRGHAWSQMFSGRILCFSGSLFLCIWFLLNQDGEGWFVALPILGASLVVGIGFVLGGPAQQSVIPSLVRSDELATAMMLNTTPMTIARIAGPAVGAIITASFGPEYAFAVAAFMHFIFAMLLMMIRFPKPEKTPAGDDDSVRNALKHVWNDKPLILLLLAVMAVGVGSEPTTTLAPGLSHLLRGDESLVGSLMTSFGTGSVLGLITVTTVGKRYGEAWATFAGLGCMAVGMLLVAVALLAPAATFGFALAGLGFTWAMSAASTMVQRRVPEALRGRVMAFWMIAFIGSRPLAATLIGALADATSTSVAIGATSALLVISAIVCRPSRLLRG